MIVCRLLWILSLSATVSSKIYLRPSNAVAECPHLKPQEDFVGLNFIGSWYKVFALPSALTLGAKCVVSTFILSDESKLKFYKKFIDARGLEVRLIGEAKIIRQGVLSVHFPAFREFLWIWVTIK